MLNAAVWADRTSRHTVAVVGGGASGMLFAAQLLNRSVGAAPGLRVALIDRRERLGGVAYSTTDADHRLNVCVAGMSAFPDDPDDFDRWRERLGDAREPTAYASRAEYGRYLHDVLELAQRRAAPFASLVRLLGEVASVEPSRDQVTLAFADGRVVAADLAVLALGNLTAAPPPSCEPVVGLGRYVDDPWASGRLERLGSEPDEGPVLLIGSGLTMVDVALTISRRSPGRRIIAMSRNGLLPRGHVAGAVPTAPALTRVDPHISFAELVDRVLGEAANGGDRWRQMVDGLRPVTQAHWRRLSLDERATFLATRHRAWSVHRHRMAPEVARRITALLESGQLEIRRGIPELELSADGRPVLALPDGDRVALALVVNCTGPTLDPRASTDPLVRQLLRAEHVRAHPVGLGFDTASGGAFRRPAGGLQPRLLTLGPTRMGELYETTAIPEIRAQASELALGVIARLEDGHDAGRLSAQIG